MSRNAIYERILHRSCQTYSCLDVSPLCNAGCTDTQTVQYAPVVLHALTDNKQHTDSQEMTASTLSMRDEAEYESGHKKNLVTYPNMALVISHKLLTHHIVLARI